MKNKYNKKYNTVFISDTHLGNSHCNSKELLKFLKTFTAKKIYLVGDIIDMTKLQRKFFWKWSYNSIIRQILKHVKHGTKVIYIKGNHDHQIKEFIKNTIDFAGVVFKEDDVHVCEDGTRLYITHGDKFDGVMREKMFWLYNVGDFLYDKLIFLNMLTNQIRRFFLLNEWSLVYYLKSKAKNVVKFIGQYEALLLKEAQKHNTEGIIAGHLHRPELKQDEFIYGNCGSWVENCSAIVEHENGKLELLLIKGE
jgi:UDP-2,3-diacylglucosamine pyrophosphatase LpxH